MALLESEMFEDEFPLFRSCPVLNEIRLSEEIEDVTIEVKDDARCNVHRIVLAARIPALRESLRGPHSEKTSILRWPTVPMKSAILLVNYAYTGQIELSQDNINDIFILAKITNLHIFEDWGVKFLTARVNLDNLSNIWDIAQTFKLASLTHVCTHLMKVQFEGFVASDLFIRLPAETVLTLLRKDDLEVTSEEEVVAAIDRWICPNNEVDQHRLELYAPAMMKEVRWCQTTLQVRKNLVSTHKIFNQGLHCARLMVQVEQWMWFAEKDKPPCPFNQSPRQRGGRADSVSNSSDDYEVCAMGSSRSNSPRSRSQSPIRSSHSQSPRSRSQSPIASTSGAPIRSRSRSPIRSSHSQSPRSRSQSRSSDPVRLLTSVGDNGLCDTCATPTPAYSTRRFAAPTLGKVFFGAASTGTSGSTIGSGGLFCSASNISASGRVGLLGFSTGASSSGNHLRSTAPVSEGLDRAATGFGSPPAFGSVNAAEVNPLIFPIPRSSSAYTGGLGLLPVSGQSTSFSAADAGSLFSGEVNSANTPTFASLTHNTSSPPA